MNKKKCPEKGIQQYVKIDENIQQNAIISIVATSKYGSSLVNGSFSNVSHRCVSPRERFSSI